MTAPERFADSQIPLAPRAPRARGGFTVRAHPIGGWDGAAIAASVQKNSGLPVRLAGRTVAG
jgi:hypothetical protein